MTQQFLKFLDEIFSVARKIEGLRTQDLVQIQPTTQSNTSSPEKLPITPTQNDPILKCSESISRPMIRLTLHMLYEADTFLNTQLISERLDKMNNLESLWKENFDTGKKGSVLEAMEVYKKQKMQEWEQEKQKITNTMKDSLSRLNFLIKGVILIGKSPQHYLLYILTFLYKSMKRSYESKGVGAELILVLFKEILLICKKQNLLDTSLLSFSDEQIVTLFMKHFSFPDKEFCMYNQLSEACEYYITQEQLYSSSVYSSIEKRKEEETKNIKSTVFQEQQQQEKFISIWDFELDKFKKFESNSKSYFYHFFFLLTPKKKKGRNSLKISLDQKKYLLAKTWTRLMRSLSSPRGPWAPIEWEGNTPTRVIGNSVFEFWKLDPVETGSRLRILHKPNYYFQDHSSTSRRDPNESNSKKFDTFHSKNLVWSQFIVKPTQEESKDEEEHEGSDVQESSRKQTQQLMDTNAKIEHTEINKIYRTDCFMIKPMQRIKGILEINKQNISFYALDVKDSSVIEKKYSENKKWEINDIKDIQTRNYLHEKTALEIFFHNKKAYFFNFDETDRDLVYKKIIEHKPINIQPYHFSAFSFGPPSPSTLLKKLNVTELWRKREISNFDYLMAINTIAGRTYNDLSQYPIFPWVLNDYTSESIDLNDPKVYRDLSKPIGALTQDRLESFLDRYNHFDDPVIPKFLYGSHYSSAGTVLYYLVRMEPFTTHSITLQGGQFDVTDRMFTSIANCWNGCLTNSSDVKELIPEFFYLPEFLVNKNNFDFGKNQKGDQMSDVWLPNWAKSAEHFIEVNRNALGKKKIFFFL